MRTINIYFVVAWIFGLSAVFYLLGYHGIGIDMMMQYETTDPSSVIINFFTNFMTFIGTWTGLLVVGIGITTAIMMSGFNFYAVLPLILGYTLLNFLVFPTSIINVLPSPLGIICIGFFNLMIMLSLVAFVRGG